MLKWIKEKLGVGEATTTPKETTLPSASIHPADRKRPGVHRAKPEKEKPEAKPAPIKDQSGMTEKDLEELRLAEFILMQVSPKEIIRLEIIITEKLRQEWDEQNGKQADDSRRGEHKIKAWKFDPEKFAKDADELNKRLRDHCYSFQITYAEYFECWILRYIHEEKQKQARKKGVFIPGCDILNIAILREIERRARILFKLSENPKPEDPIFEQFKKKSEDGFAEIHKRAQERQTIQQATRQLQKEAKRDHDEGKNPGPITPEMITERSKKLAEIDEQRRLAALKKAEPTGLEASQM